MIYCWMPCFCRRYVSVQKHKKTFFCCYLGSMLVWLFFFRVGGWGRQEDFWFWKYVFCWGKMGLMTQQLIEVEYLFVVCEDFASWGDVSNVWKERDPGKSTIQQKLLKRGSQIFSDTRMKQENCTRWLGQIQKIFTKQTTNYSSIHDYPGTLP